MHKIPKTQELFDIRHTIAEVMLDECEYPHEALTKIKDFIIECSPMLEHFYKEASSDVYIADDAKIWPGVSISGPAIIGHKAEIRPGAFIRGNVIIGDGVEVVNSLSYSLYLESIVIGRDVEQIVDMYYMRGVKKVVDLRLSSSEHDAYIEGLINLLHR